MPVPADPPEPWLPPLCGSPRRFAPGDRLFTAGDPPDGLFVIDAGRVQVFRVTEGGGERLVAEFGPGETVGEMAAIEAVPHTASARATTAAEVRFVSRPELLYLLERRPQRTLGFIRTVIQRARESDRRHVEEMVQAERLAAVGQFTRTIVHDFKSPLAAIRWSAELAGAEDTPPAVRQAAQVRITRQADRMGQMLQELIEFTRPGGQQAELQPADLGGFLAAFAAETAPELADRRVRLVLEETPAGVTVRLNPARFSRLLHNLCNNAVDAMGKGGSIFLRAALGEGGARVEVEDTGAGIPAAVADRLFTPFATHGKAHGTGLGLSICRRIAEDHGGRISVRPSEPGRGATFVIEVPVGAAAV